jgi:hypothetical protein
LDNFFILYVYSQLKNRTNVNAKDRWRTLLNQNNAPIEIQNDESQNDESQN